jgi:hypothetical protein
MSTQPSDDQPTTSTYAELERAFIEEYLRGQGCEPDQLRALPRPQAQALMRAASLYASVRLSEVESRSHLIEELHGGPHAI